MRLGLHFLSQPSDFIVYHRVVFRTEKTFQHNCTFDYELSLASIHFVAISAHSSPCPDVNALERLI